MRPLKCTYLSTSAKLRPSLVGHVHSAFLRHSFVHKLDFPPQSQLKKSFHTVLFDSNRSCEALKSRDFEIFKASDRKERENNAPLTNEANVTYH